MTVKFASRLATKSAWGSFTKLLFRWRGSVYKLIWREYLIYISLYFLISFIYRYALGSCQQRFFEKLVNHIHESTGSFVRMSFVLGFFVNSIVCNWWKLQNLIPRPDTLALLVSTYIPGETEDIKQIRKTLMRYAILNLTQTFRSISPALKQKYPHLSDLVKAGMLTEDEKILLEKAEKQTTHCAHWVPIKWAIELLMKSHKQGRILNESGCSKIMDALDRFRNGCANLLEYESLSVPLVYIQVVTLCVYSYFLAQLLGSQWDIVPDKEAQKEIENGTVTTQCEHFNSHADLDLYFPFMTTLQFVFYMGWLKVAESLINPFGSDDDDFELDEIVDRHLEVSYMMVNAPRDKPQHINLQTCPEETHFTNFGLRGDRPGSLESIGGVSTIALIEEKPTRERKRTACPTLVDVASLEDGGTNGQRSSTGGRQTSNAKESRGDSNNKIQSACW